MSNEPENQSSEKPQEPSAEHERLEIFVGKWNTVGEVWTDADASPIKLIATDTYEWLPGKFFLLHRVDANIGDEKTEALEIIGYDASRGIYYTNSFDSQGNADTFQTNLHDCSWTIEGESTRFKGMFSEDGSTLAGKWERSSDGVNWQPWIDLRLTKAD